MVTETESPLTAERVKTIFHDCIFKTKEIKEIGEEAALSSAVKAEGITVNMAFHPGRLERHEAEISQMLDELPDAFKESGGGGMSFLNACDDKHGRQWTGLHQTMEQLFQLGIAIGRVESTLPREMWSALPGGMPYYVIKDA